VSRHEHLISTRSRTITCPRCHATLLAAHDSGEPVTVDATPLPDRTAEIAALLQNRRTYIHTFGRQLIHRTPEKIRAGWPTGTIHARHQCPQQQLAQQTRQQFATARHYGKETRHHARLRTQDIANA
jgi:hypothetical protein